MWTLYIPTFRLVHRCLQSPRLRFAGMHRVRMDLWYKTSRCMYSFLFDIYQMSHKYMGFEIKIFYLTGADNLSRDIEMMLGRGVPVYMRIMWCIVTPVILTVRAFREK